MATKTYTRVYLQGVAHPLYVKTPADEVKKAITTGREFITLEYHEDTRVDVRADAINAIDAYVLEAP